MKQRTKRDWKSLTTRQKIQQIWDYYKLPIFIACVLIYMLGYTIYRHETVKEKVFYTGLINVAPGEDLTKQLYKDFEETIVTNPKKEEMEFYTGLYLTDNTKSEFYQYSYTSQMKILAAIDAQQLDLVLMDKEAFDAFSQNGYLYPLDEFIAEFPELKGCTDGLLVENITILESNAMDVAFDPSLEYESVTETHYYGLDMSQHGYLADADLSGTVYLAILLNTPRKEICAKYIEHLL